jgi:hypothetical protein
MPSYILIKIILYFITEHSDKKRWSDRGGAAKSLLQFDEIDREHLEENNKLKCQKVHCFITRMGGGGEAKKMFSLFLKK